MLCLLFRKELEKIIISLSSGLQGGALAASARWQAGNPACPCPSSSVVRAPAIDQLRQKGIQRPALGAGRR